MGNEMSSHEMPSDRSRSLSPLPRDDMLPHDELDPTEASNPGTDSDHEPPPSAQSPRKRIRRNSDSRGRKKRKAAQPSGMRSNRLGEQQSGDEDSELVGQALTGRTNSGSGTEPLDSPTRLVAGRATAENDSANEVAPSEHGHSEGNQEAKTQAEEHRIPSSSFPSSPVRSTELRQSAKRKAKRPIVIEEEQENTAAVASLALDDAAAPPRPSRPRRAKSPVHNEGIPSTASPMMRQKKRIKHPDPNNSEPEEPEDRSAPDKPRYRSGPMSATEKNQIVGAVERFREDESLSQEEVNQIIQENPLASKKAIHHRLWASVQDACPSRPRQKLINWCRQRFHNFAGRGSWTQEQDDELAELVEVHGKKWSYIGGLINRHQKDVRDRWRNYLVCRESVKTDEWSEAEEDRLREVVEDAIDKIQENLSENARKTPEELINWLYISEALGRTRSRLQCMEKWKRMRAAEPIGDKIPTILPQGSSWRLEKARKDLRKLTVNDKYTLMRAIRDSGVGKDAKISWKEIVSGTFGDKFERQALIVTWGRLRQAVPDWEWKTTHDCARYLCEMYEREGNFGTAEDAEEAEEAEETEGRSPVKKEPKGKVKGKKAVRASSGQPRARRGKTKSSPQPDTAPSSTSKTGEVVEENVVMEDQAAPESWSSASKKSRQAAIELSPELDVASPSVEAEAARMRRREKRSSIEDMSSGRAEKTDAVPLTPKSTEPKVSKRRRRESVSNHKGEDAVSEKLKPSKGSSASRAKTNSVQLSSNGDGGKSWSVISSDMDDMDDIPATLPPSSQVPH
ncbi:hypothetical protein VTI74DRAFT_411 [Chaetomium olivicolor]